MWCKSCDGGSHSIDWVREMVKQRSYLGTGWGFPPTFIKGLGVQMASDVEDINQSLSILLSTQVGERIMQPRYGCNIKQLVFEPLDSSLQTYVQDLIHNAILDFEPRIILNSVKLEPSASEGRINIYLDYTIASTNSRHNFVFPFYREEGTEIIR